VELSSSFSAINRKSCAQTFPPILGLFEIFDHNFAKLVAPPSNNNQNYLMHLKRQSMLKNDISIIKIDRQTATQHLFKVCHRSGKLQALNLLTGQKSGFSPRRGDSLHRFRSNFAGPTGTWVRLAVQNFTSIATGGGNAAPKMSKISNPAGNN